ncbi:hypothetical protein E2C01_026335 [Portunus trituberculatus]|uniref:Uncharacterized protein n=1 Tax=Portunus trituberculatus TaxID=210409 RepID=A0A5B7EIA2_PORTR|nr:hypothetical protein [Portunus trituberculatus]
MSIKLIKLLLESHCRTGKQRWMGGHTIEWSERKHEIKTTLETREHRRTARNLARMDKRLFEG